MKCENCGNEIHSIKTQEFFLTGLDEVEYPIAEDDVYGEVSFFTNKDWAGYGLTPKEQCELITCPCCGKSPFRRQDVQLDDAIKVTMWKGD